jgi:hypothetical protein
LILGASKTKNPKILAPLLPLGFVYAFQYDMVYGNMMERAMATADTLIVEHPMKFAMPPHGGIVDPEEYMNILNIKDGKKMI